MMSKDYTFKIIMLTQKNFHLPFLYNSFFFTVRPLEVEILFNNQPLSADRQYEVQCQTIGSRPPSVITWWMGGMAIVALPTKVRKINSNFSVVFSVVFYFSSVPRILINIVVFFCIF